MTEQEAETLHLLSVRMSKVDTIVGEMERTLPDVAPGRTAGIQAWARRLREAMRWTGKIGNT